MTCMYAKVFLHTFHMLDSRIYELFDTIRAMNTTSPVEVGEELSVPHMTPKTYVHRC